MGRFDHEDRVDPVVAVNASSNAGGRCHRLAASAVALAGDGDLVDLAELDAAALLGRRHDRGVGQALSTVKAAPRVVLLSPVCLGSYSALLQAFFQLLPDDCLAGRPVVLGGTADRWIDFTVLDGALRDLVGRFGGRVTETSAYGTDEDFEPDGEPGPVLVRALRRALTE